MAKTAQIRLYMKCRVDSAKPNDKIDMGDRETTKRSDGSILAAYLYPMFDVPEEVLQSKIIKAVVTIPAVTGEGSSYGIKALGATSYPENSDKISWNTVCARWWSSDIRPMTLISSSTIQRPNVTNPAYDDNIITYDLEDNSTGELTLFPVTGLLSYCSYRYPAEAYVFTDSIATMEVTYEPVPNVVGSCSPTSGVIHKLKPTTFRWSHRPEREEEYAVFDFSSGRKSRATAPQALTQTGAEFRWREKEGSPVKTVPVSGADEKVTIPGGTFTTDSIQWSVAITTNGGVITSEWYTLSTVEELSTARCLKPSGDIEDGTSAITFLWEHIIGTGTLPTGADIETSRTGQSWAQLAHVDGDATEYTTPPGKFSAGSVYWRVRTYNSDGRPGEWSAPAKFLVVAAPPTPALTVERSTPKFVVRWQQSGQQEYEIRLRDAGGAERIVAQRYSVESRYTYDDYAPLGPATISVRVQNQYGLWSGWGMADTVIEDNSPREVAAIAEQRGPAASITVTTTPRWWDRLSIYRDGELIGHTAGVEYVDYFAPTGKSTYTVRAEDSKAGTCAYSAPAAITVDYQHMIITAIDSISWLRIDTSASSLRETSWRVGQAVGYSHVAGRALPLAEIGEARSVTYAFDVAFAAEDLEPARAFEALIGRAVCVKDQYGNVAIGVLESTGIGQNAFIRRYSVSLTVTGREVIDQ